MVLNSKGGFIVKIHSILLSGLLAMQAVAAVEGNHGRYYAELQALKEAPETKMMFDEDTQQILAQIQSAVITDKNVSLFEQLIKKFFLQDKDVFMVTPETMPLLYNYVEEVCKKANISCPAVFISRKNFKNNKPQDNKLPQNFFEMIERMLKWQRINTNAFAVNPFLSKGLVYIDQEMVRDFSDQALEAAITHEIGHIRYNHSNILILRQALAVLIMSKVPEIWVNGLSYTIHNVNWFPYVVAWSILQIMVNKRLEKQADEFAYADNDQGHGLIELFEKFLQNEALAEKEFVTIYELLQANKASLNCVNYYQLLSQYYFEKCGHKLHKLLLKIKDETFWGDHPSYQARIAVVREYLAQQEDQDKPSENKIAWYNQERIKAIISGALAGGAFAVAAIPLVHRIAIAVAASK